MMEHQERYAWLQLAFTPHIGAESFAVLLEHYGSAQATLQAPPEAIRSLAYQGALAAVRWTNTEQARAAADAALQWEQQSGCRLMLSSDADFPMMLREGITPPPVLFLRGRTELLHRPAVGMVGSRHATPQAERIAKRFAAALGEQGVTVVSGMAAGVDTAAHFGALETQGGTVAVWGTGIDRIYPQSNKQLAHRLAEEGLIVSEFPLGTRPIAGNFPRRNRLIAAQSRVTLVVEATIDSGSLITARQAGEMGREVMAIPGSIDNPHSKGCHKLIKEGAKLVDSVDDVLAECPDLLAAVPAPAAFVHTETACLSTNLSTDAAPSEIAPNEAPPLEASAPNPPAPKAAAAAEADSDDNALPEAKLLLHMGYDPVHPDVLAEILHCDAGAVYARLIELELEGKVATVAGGRFQRVG